MERLPPLKALQVFQVAAQCLSFKLAAEQLHVTQAAVSQQIKLLESHLDVTLFERLNREVRLTAEAKLLLPHVERGFAAFSEGVRLLRQDPFPNQLTITTVPSFAGSWLVPRLGQFQQKHLDLSCRISLSHTLQNFSDGSVDVGIRFGTGNYPELDVTPLSPDYNLPLCHPSLVEQINQPGRSITELPLLIDESPELDRMIGQFINCCGEGGERSSSLLISDSNMLVDAALSGQGIALIRYSLAYKHIERGQLVCPLPIYWNSPYAYYLVTSPAHLKRDKVTKFSSWIKNEIEEIESSWAEFSKNNNMRCID